MKYIKVILFILVLSWAMSVVAQDKEKLWNTGGGSKTLLLILL